MAKLVDKRFEELGADRVFKLGLGDDDSSLEDDFASWKKELWPALCQIYGMDFENIDLAASASYNC
jgi:NADPH-ferrihemoprotein reductase